MKRDAWVAGKQRHQQLDRPGLVAILRTAIGLAIGQAVRQTIE